MAHGQLSTARAAQLHVRHVLTAAGGAARQAGLTWLQAREAVHWVSPAAVLRPLNLHAVRIAQSGCGGGGGGGDGDGGGGGGGTGAAPLWAAGLAGQGQIVGMGDSGVDVDSCFFHHEGVVPGASSWPLGSYASHLRLG